MSEHAKPLQHISTDMRSHQSAAIGNAGYTPISNVKQPTCAQGLGTKQPLPFLDSKMLNLLVGFVLAALWGLFAYRHVTAFHDTREWAYLLICVSETLTAAFFLLRSAPKTVSTDPFDWLFAVAGTFTPLLFVPTAWALLPAAEQLIAIGTVLQIFGLISLNRSFALVAAKRALKTKGMYRYMRHPLYASYLLIFTGYLLANTSLMNFALYLMTMGFLFVRMLREEKHLALDPAYGDYMQQVRFRVIPFLF